MGRFGGQNNPAPGWRRTPSADQEGANGASQTAPKETLIVSVWGPPGYEKEGGGPFIVGIRGELGGHILNPTRASLAGRSEAEIPIYRGIEY